MKEDYNPLVTIGVLTYNSSKYVLETLESARAQTYKNIELIISDDCSTDNTVELCREWVEKNKDRFVRCEILTVEKNTGIPANCNRLLRESKGRWFKLIAGDDILASDCIESFINFVKGNPEAEIACAKVQVFEEVFNVQNFKSIIGCSLAFSFAEARVQHRMLASKNQIKAPSVFAKTELLRSVGGYDESWMAEDYPMWMKLTRRGTKIYFLDRIVVFYRRGESILLKSEKLFNERYFFNMHEWAKQERYPYLSVIQRMVYWYFHIVYRAFCGNIFNKSTRTRRFFFNFLMGRWGIRSKFFSLIRSK